MDNKLRFKEYRFEFFEESDYFKLHFLTKKTSYFALFDLDDFEFIKNLTEKYYIAYDNGKSLIYYDNKKRYLISRLLINTKEKVYYINSDKCDLRKNNLTLYRKDVIGLREKCSEKFAKQDKELFYNNMKKRYCKDYSKKLAITKAGEYNPSTKLSYESVEKIRMDYETNHFSQVALSKKYNISRSNIADIVNYRTWAFKENTSLRVYKEQNIIKDELKNFETFYLDENLNEFVLLTNNLKIYIEKLPIDRLVYIEVHENNKYLFNIDLYFPIEKKISQKEDYIICSRNPHLTHRELIDKTIKNIFNV